MAVLKVGDWVMVKYDGVVGQVTVMDFNKGYHLVDLKDKTFARLINKDDLLPIDPAFNVLLTSVNK